MTDGVKILYGAAALGIFAGFACLMFLLAIEFLKISKMEKIILTVLILLGILFISAVNFPLVWILLGFSSLVIFVYKISITLEVKKKFPTIPLIVVLVSLLFVLNPLLPIPKGAGSPLYLANIIPSYLQVPNTEVSPSLGATMYVTKGVLTKNPLLGIGPNRFTEAWAMHKPNSVNNNEFWNTSFSSGSGLIPTLISTTGYLGILALVIFSILFLSIGVRSILYSIKGGLNFEIMAFFILSLYLFISSFFYSTGTVIFLLAFAFTGVFIGLIAKEVSISFLDDRRKNFLSTLVLILIIIISIAVSFKYIQRFTSVFYFGQALRASTVTLAEDSINKALALSVNDLYLRTYAEIYLIKLDSLIKKGESVSDAEKASLQAVLDQAINGAQLATVYNEANYLNFQALGSIYQRLASFGVKDASREAIEAYKVAATLNPNHPGIKLDIAGVYFGDGKIQEAKDYANLALTLKPDYADALITLSQIAKSEGDNALALQYGERALSIFPANADLIKYVDSLKNETSITTPPAKTP